MFIQVNIERVMLFQRILDRPDPACLRGRGTVVKFSGDAGRWKRWIPRLLRAQRDALIAARPWIQPDEIATTDGLTDGTTVQ